MDFNPILREEKEARKQTHRGKYIVMTEVEMALMSARQGTQKFTSSISS